MQLFLLRVYPKWRQYHSYLSQISLRLKIASLWQFLIISPPSERKKRWFLLFLDHEIHTWVILKQICLSKVAQSMFVSNLVITKNIRNNLNKVNLFLNVPTFPWKNIFALQRKSENSMRAISRGYISETWNFLKIKIYTFVNIGPD